MRLPPPGGRRWGVRAALLVVLLLILVPIASTRLTDWMWYKDVGYERVFLTKIVAQWILAVTAGVVSLVTLYVNGRIALRGAHTRNLHIRDVREWAADGPARMFERVAAWLLLPAAILVAVVTGAASAGQWREAAQFFYRTPFGVTDPVFHRDIAYYVFSIPMVENVLAFARSTLWLALLFFCGGIYLARADIGFQPGARQQPWRFYITPRAQLHLAILIALLLVTAALNTTLVDLPSLLLAQRPVLYGATYTDLHVRLPWLRVLALLYVALAGVVVWYAARGQLARGVVVVAVLTIAADIGLDGVIPALYQRLVVQPNELDRETPQIRYHIAATRQAWGLDGIERRELNGERDLTMHDIEANQVTVRNVRLWDREPLLQTYGQLQSIRTYYDFASVDDDRYQINGEERQVLLAPRELNTAALPTRTFINEHLTYTHGMGLTLGPSNQVTPEGLPTLWIKDLPPVSSIPITVTRPQIYFGEISNEFVLAPTRQREFDYPSGEGEAAVYSNYKPGTGVSVGSFFTRLLFAFRFGSLNIMLSSDLTPETRILFHRDVLERAQLALPFLRFDPDPYMVITGDGRLEWMLDGYTWTDRYPYAASLPDGTNYIRNSVKVVVDAYSGETRAYLALPNDPMIRTLSRIYPGLLHPLSEMPADLRSHVRYPGTLFAAQSALYATYHMTDPETFYHREDQWQIPGVAGANQQGDAGDTWQAFMRHIVTRLPGEAQPEYVLMRPFTPRQKDNLSAWMVVRNDGDNYGKMLVYQFPRQSLVFGPVQIVNRINQDTEVSRQVTLWDQRGSEVIRGELLVIPIGESLIYVQPLYLRAAGGRIPELKRVVVAVENQVAMDETLESALARLFEGRPAAAATPSQAAPAAPTAATESQAQLARDAQATYERARAAQRNEDWATYGAEMKRLGDILQRLSSGGGVRP